MNPWLSILPPHITIALAIGSKRILPALLVGLLAGGYLLRPTLTGGFESAVGSVSAYAIWLRAIPLEFFSIVVLLITFLSIFFQFKQRAKRSIHDHSGMSAGRARFGSEAEMAANTEMRLASALPKYQKKNRLRRQLMEHQYFQILRRS